MRRHKQTQELLPEAQSKDTRSACPSFPPRNITKPRKRGQESSLVSWAVSSERALGYLPCLPARLPEHWLRLPRCFGGARAHPPTVATHEYAFAVMREIDAFASSSSTMYEPSSSVRSANLASLLGTPLGLH